MNPKRSTRYDDGRAEPNDPSDPRSAPFDWDMLEAAMGEAEVDPIDYQRLGYAIGALIDWLVMPNPGRRGSRDRLKLYGVRLLALAWIVRPDVFDGRPSLRKLAKQHNIDRWVLSRAAARTAARYGVQNAEQSHQQHVVIGDRVHHAVRQRKRKAKNA